MKLWAKSVQRVHAQLGKIMEFTFKLSEADANLILEALGNMPFKTSSPLIQNMVGQAQAQLPKQAPPVEDVS